MRFEIDGIRAWKMLGLIIELPKYLIFIDIYDMLIQESQFLKFFSVFWNLLHSETVELIFVISLNLVRFIFEGMARIFGQFLWKKVWGWKEMNVCIGFFPYHTFCGSLRFYFGVIIDIAGDLKKLGWTGSILCVLNERI